NELNGRSGTIRGRALFENSDQFLTPGSFGRLRLWAGDADAMLVPDSAIVSDQARKVVLTVGPENKVVPKIVSLGGLADGLRIIRDGLKGDEKVIIGGLANPFVRPGAPVTPVPGDIKAGMR
ncbi:MAG: efflux RND transporter periplasmic adaptor subunit, partial [Elstera sp.]